MVASPAAGPLQRPLLLASSGVDVDTVAQVDAVQGSKTGPGGVSPRDGCNRGRTVHEADTVRATSGSTTTDSSRRPEPEKGSICCRRVGELLAIYAETLETDPLRTKCVTSAVLAAVGDVVAQTVLWARGGDALWCNTNAVWQTVAVALQSFFFSAPFLHWVYGTLERWIPTAESSASAIAQVTIDVFVIDPILAIAFIVQVGLLEGQSFGGDIVPTIKADYLTLVFWLVVTGLLVGPGQVYLFKRFPLKWRVLIADGKDLLWTFVACFIVET